MARFVIAVASVDSFREAEEDPVPGEVRAGTGHVDRRLRMPAAWLVERDDNLAAFVYSSKAVQLCIVELVLSGRP